MYEQINYLSLNVIYNVFNKTLLIDLTNKFEYKINYYIIEYVYIYKKTANYIQLTSFVLIFGMV